MGFFQRKYIEYFVVLATAFGLLFGAYSFIKMQFNELATNIIEPYQKLLIANSLEDEDRAIIAFRDALKGMQDQNVEVELLSAVVSPFLKAIANSEMPYSYQHYTKKLEEIIGDKLPIDYNTSNSLGWIYLATDNNKQAQKHFKKSISLFKQADLFSEAANSYEGLMYSYLAGDELIKAIEAHESAWKLSYEDNNPQATVWLNYKDVTWIKRLFRIYPKMEVNYSALVKYQTVMYDLKPKVEPKEINMDILDKILAED